jgi:putative endonuclease
LNSKPTSNPKRKPKPDPNRKPKPIDARRALGAEGEERAARYLTRRGYRIVDRNVRAGGVEIDLIACRGTLVVFVEVKTRRSTRFGDPELAVDAAKQSRIVRGAAAWLQNHRGRAVRVRFDVIAWQVQASGQFPGSRWRVRHIEGAFDAGT